MYFKGFLPDFSVILISLYRSSAEIYALEISWSSRFLKLFQITIFVRNFLKNYIFRLFEFGLYFSIVGLKFNFGPRIYIFCRRRIPLPAPFFVGRWRRRRRTYFWGLCCWYCSRRRWSSWWWEQGAPLWPIPRTFAGPKTAEKTQIFTIENSGFCQKIFGQIFDYPFFLKICNIPADLICLSNFWRLAQFFSFSNYFLA